jgi:steroid delta-isomerase-like uncharacterized protein
MSEENKSLARQWNKIFEGDFALADDIIDEDCVYHNGPPDVLPGPDGVKEWAIMVRNAFPDIRVTEEDYVAEGDKVVGRFSAQGTHNGEFFGVPATGNPITLVGINIMRISNGKIAEHWAQIDSVGLMQQVGAIPGSG